MRDESLRQALGLAQRAGRLLSGDFACEKAVKEGRALLIALDAEASEATRARYEGLCERAGIPCIRVAALGAAIGREERKIAAVIDGGFARMIEQKAHGGFD